MGYQNYILDSAIPKQHIQFNGTVDMPFGHGKRFLGGSNHFMDELVGGWQVAGDGNIRSQDFQHANGNWGPTNPLRIYKHKAKITDCRGGVCRQAFEWFNGYLFPTVTTDCTSNCVTGPLRMGAMRARSIQLPPRSITGLEHLQYYCRL